MTTLRLILGDQLNAAATEGGNLLVTLADDASSPRARPPQWPQDVLDVFFDDARDQLGIF